jgi:hypothetical protein
MMQRRKVVFWNSFIEDILKIKQILGILSLIICLIGVKGNENRPDQTANERSYAQNCIECFMLHIVSGICKIIELNEAQPNCRKELKPP